MPNALRLVRSSLAGATALAPWDALIPTQPATGPFLTHAFATVWWRHFGAGLTDLTLVAPDRAVLPLYLDAEGTVSFFGGYHLTDYLGPLCAPDDRAALAGALLDYLQSAAAPPWRRLRLEPVPAVWGFTGQVAKAAAERGFESSDAEVEVAAVLDLPLDYEAWLAALSSKERHETRRKVRRFEAEAGARHLRTADTASLVSDLDRFLAMHRQAQGEKGSFMDRAHEAFFRDLAATFITSGALRVDALETAAGPVAYSFGFADSDVYYLYNSAYDRSVHHLSPGVVLLASLVESELHAGRRTFDFLRGDETYKFRLGARAVPLHRCTVEARAA